MLDIVYLDFSKPFNKISHEILIREIVKPGLDHAFIRGLQTSWAIAPSECTSVALQQTREEDKVEFHMVPYEDKCIVVEDSWGGHEVALDNV